MKKYIKAVLLILAILLICNFFDKYTSIISGIEFFIVVFITFFVIFIPDERCTQYSLVRKLIKKGGSEMIELAKKFVGKECVIYTFNGSALEGTITEISGNAMLIDTSGSIEAVNLEFVTRIREYPRNKKGKKKSLVLD